MTVWHNDDLWLCWLNHMWWRASWFRTNNDRLRCWRGPSAFTSMASRASRAAPTSLHDHSGWYHRHHTRRCHTHSRCHTHTRRRHTHTRTRASRATPTQWLHIHADRCIIPPVGTIPIGAIPIGAPEGAIPIGAPADGAITIGAPEGVIHTGTSELLELLLDGIIITCLMHN